MREVILVALFVCMNAVPALAQLNNGYCCIGGSGGPVPAGGCGMVSGSTWQPNPCGTTNQTGSGACPEGMCPCGGGSSPGGGNESGTTGMNFIKWLDHHFSIVPKACAVQNQGNSGCCPCGGGSGNPNPNPTPTPTPTPTTTSCTVDGGTCDSIIDDVGCF